MASARKVAGCSVADCYHAKKDLFLAQRFARRASPLTTILYTDPSDEGLCAGLRDLPFGAR